MEILWLTENYPPQQGGMSQSCDRIVGNLRRKGVKIHVIHFSNRKSPFHKEEILNGTYTAVPKYMDMEHSLHITLTFLKNNFKDKVDFIVSFGGLFTLAAIPVYSKILNLPFYLCFRGNDFDISLFSYRKKYMLDQAIMHSKGIFVNSTDKLENIKLLYPEKECFFVPNGIDLDNWLPLKSELEFATKWRKDTNLNKRIVIGLFGFLKVKKGVLFFIDCIIKNRMMDNIHFIFSGELEEAVQDRLLEYNMSYTVLPHLKRIELIKHYCCCDWIAIPSFYEGMPNVLMEAGGLKIPVIASAVDGMKDVLEEGNGILFEALNMGECARAVRKILEMAEEERIALGEKLFYHLRDNYTPEKEGTHYINTFNHHGYIS